MRFCAAFSPTAGVNAAINNNDMLSVRLGDWAGLSHATGRTSQKFGAVPAASGQPRRNVAPFPQRRDGFAEMWRRSRSVGTALQKCGAVPAASGQLRRNVAPFPRRRDGFAEIRRPFRSAGTVSQESGVLPAAPGALCRRRRRAQKGRRFSRFTAMASGRKAAILFLHLATPTFQSPLRATAGRANSENIRAAAADFGGKRLSLHACFRLSIDGNI